MQRHRSLPSLSGRGRARHAAASTTAGATITLQGADGASLAGHTFNVYRIGTYTDQILNGTRISSLGVRGDTASNAWAADAIGIANAYDPDTADDIAKVYGYDDAGNIANIKMDSQTRQLRNISKALGQSTRKPAAIQGGANLTTTQSTLTINVPAEGLYYITDSAGNPIMVGTKSGNANIMKNDAKDPQWRTLGVAVVKAKSMRADKKVSDSSSNAEAKQQAAADAKSEADAKKEAADEAQDKLPQGAVAYFGDKGASQAVKVLTDPTVTEYLDAIHNGAKGDATTLDNMIEALKFIQEANQLRAKEGLQPLKVSDTLMAQAMADADYANNNVNHPLQFPASENLAWGYTDPFNGWYDTEKSMYEKDMSDGVLDCKASDGKPVKPCAYGHYTTLVNTDFTLTGFGVSQNGNITGIGGNTHSQLFTENANGIGSDAGRIMDVDAYLTDLTAYRDSLTGADAAYQTALAKSEQAAQDASDAAKALAAAQQSARKAAEEAQQAAQKARDLQAAADEAQKAYDEAVKANADKAKALEEARKDQADKNAAYSAAQQATKEARSEADAATAAQTAAQTAVDKANTAVDAAQAKIDAADKLAQTAAKNKTDAEAAIKQANTDKTKALADLADAKAAKAEAEKAKQAALEAKTVSDAKVEAADKQVKAADEAIADAKAAYAKAKDDLNAATGKLNDAQNTIKRLQNAEENLKKANAKLADAQAKLDEANKAKDAADKAYEKAKADYDAKLADKQASDKELANAKQAEAEARKKAEEEARKQQEAQKKADQAKQDAEAKKQKAEQAKKQAAGVTNNGLASTGSDTTAIATLAAIMTIAGAGCVLVRVRSAKHADGWHAVED